MWRKTHSETFTGIDVERVWAIWTDVDRWSAWQDDIEDARIDGRFEPGSVIALKPKGGPKVRVELTDVEAPRRFVDVTRFPLARMVDVHELVELADGVEITSTLTMEGPLAFLWRKLVGEGVAESLPQQTAALVAEARRA